MPTKPKNKYEIKQIELLENSKVDGKRLSIRAIAKIKGWCPVATQDWINRNYDKSVVVRYKIKEK